MQIDFSVMEGICKMLELMDKSKIAKHLHIESAQYSKCEPKTWGCFYK